MKNTNIESLEARLKSATSWWYYAEKYHNIITNKIEYTANDIDELLEYHEKREKYEVCKRLIDLKNKLTV